MTRSWRRSTTKPRLSTAGLLAAALCAVVLAVPAAATAQSAGTGVVPEAAGYAKRALARINAARRAHGLRALRPSPALARAASAHARSMGAEGYFSHVTREGVPASVRLRRYYPGSAVGEVMLWRSPALSPDQAVSSWLSSAAHRRVLLYRPFRHAGIAAIHVLGAPGVFRGLEVTIVVADFGAP